MGRKEWREEKEEENKGLVRGGRVGGVERAVNEDTWRGENGESEGKKEGRERTTRP